MDASHQFDVNARANLPNLSNQNKPGQVRQEYLAAFQAN
jgi:hypothetical protein